jgi:hypothetical protein
LSPWFVALLVSYAGYALSNAINPGSTTENGNNQERNQLVNGMEWNAMEKHNHYEPDIFYGQTVGNKADTGHWVFDCRYA